MRDGLGTVCGGGGEYNGTEGEVTKEMDAVES